MHRLPLDGEALRLLGRARIGMLALNARRQPLVNPAAYHFGAGALWMTTSRYAAKLSLANRDPRVAFSVSVPGLTLVLQGRLESFDLFSISGQVRAALAGPSFYTGLGGYMVRNAPFMGGYLLDLVRIPGEWWPQNRVVLRMRVHLWELLETVRPVRGLARSLPGVPVEIRDGLEEVSMGHLCWRSRSGVTMAPAFWSVDEAGVMAMPASDRWPSGGGAAALVVEHHHPFRATRMLGACVRGPLAADRRAGAAIDERYGGVPPGSNPKASIRIGRSRVTWWLGFEVGTNTLGRSG